MASRHKPTVYFAIRLRALAHRRLTGPGLLGAGVAVVRSVHQ